MQETQVRSLGQEDLLEKEMATHSSILVQEIPWTEESGSLQSMGSQKDTIYQLKNKNKVIIFIIGLPQWLSSKESACNAGATGDAGSIPELGRSPGEGNDNPLQYSCLENSHGQRSLAGYCPQGLKDLDRTEATQYAHFSYMFLQSVIHILVNTFAFFHNFLQYFCFNATIIPY